MVFEGMIKIVFIWIFHWESCWAQQICASRITIHRQDDNRSIRSQLALNFTVAFQHHHRPARSQGGSLRSAWIFKISLCRPDPQQISSDHNEAARVSMDQQDSQYASKIITIWTIKITMDQQDQEAISNTNRDQEDHNRSARSQWISKISMDQQDFNGSARSRISHGMCKITRDQ